MMVAATIYLLFFAMLVTGKPSLPRFRLHERRDTPPSGFELSTPAPLNSTIKLRLALVQGDIDGLHNSLYDVSTPSSENYGKHLSKEEVEQFISPKPDSVSAVNTWLTENSLNAITHSPAGDWLEIYIPVDKANVLLNTNFSVFTHTKTGLQTVRTLSYSVPTELSGHLDFVHPTTTFPDFRNVSASAAKFASVLPQSPVLQSRDLSSSCRNGTLITPACLQSLYDIPATPAKNSSSGLAVTAFDGINANEADLSGFLQRYRLDMSSTTQFTVQAVNGGTNSQNSSLAGSEADLDTQYTVGLATGVPVTLLAVGGGNNDFGQLLLDVADYLLAEKTPPQVVTTSYGSNESLFGLKVAQNVCNAFAQLGARGISVIFASGDGGVSGNEYLPTGDAKCTTFEPTFPSGCPYVTSVGSTYQLPVETAAQFSSGGFSNYWSRPSYQSSAVSQYLSRLGNNNSGLYNPTGRGFPDVATFGMNFSIVIDRTLHRALGTSCSAPTFASVIALLNGQLLSAGKQPLGFLNPFLYSQGASALTDIVSGNNSACSGKGFEATVGWDPVTGLGTPNFTSLQAAVAKLPAAGRVTLASEASWTVDRSALSITVVVALAGLIGQCVIGTI